jgi:thiamine pyrophosphate-dependent acetolactate synthase large subunit-like protein
MKRIDVVRALAELVTEEDLFVSSIGGLWDDWWNHRPGGVDGTFSPGILGSVSSTALGLSIALPHRRIVALETDGSMLLNTGILCTLGNERPPNLTVIVFDNGIYENIGGPITHTGRNTDLAMMAAGGGCPLTETVHSEDDFTALARTYLEDDQFGFLVAKIEPGRHPWEPEQRKPTDGIEDKYRFLRYVEQLERRAIHHGATHN